MLVKIRFVPLLVLLLSSKIFAGVEPLVITNDDRLVASRWMYSSELDKKVKPPVLNLVNIKKAQLSGKFQLCVSESLKVWSKLKGLDPWLMSVRIDCALRLAGEDSKQIEPLNQSIKVIEKNPEWLLSGPYSSGLRTSLIEGELLQVEIQAKNNRKLAWANVENIQGRFSWLTESGRARFYKVMGDLSFSEQRLEAAHDFYQRSMKESDSSELRRKIDQIESSLASKKPKKTLPNATPSLNGASGYLVNAQNEQSAEELELASRISLFLKSSDLLGVTSEGIKLIQKFPGSNRAKWAQDRILESYLSLFDKSDDKDKYEVLKRSILTQMFLADSERQFEWAKTMYNRGLYVESLELIKKSLPRLEPSARATKFLELGAHAAYLQDKFADAQGFYNELILKHSGTPAFREALFKSALIFFRQKDFTQSISRLERLLSVPQMENYELQARYWLWRGLEKMKSEKASEQAQIIIDKYPLSYYGIRARLEKNDGIFEVQFEKPSKVEATIWITNKTRVNWERVQLLVQAGWMDEAQAEIKELPSPTTSEEKILRARLLAAAMSYGPAIKMVNDAWDEQPSLKQESYFGIAFPQEFKNAVNENASLRGLSPYLVRGLIKQESAFQIKAVSTSNALGLMQMIPPTAKEIATDLKIEHLELPKDMFNPIQNIRMGTYYLAKVLKQFNNHVPLALASYNAGPARMERFVKSRPSLANLMTHPTSNPEDEIWFDELPWSETSFYVKAILRNFILYKAFDVGRVSYSDPIWAATK
jgi:soluble lytic murein transglycosylase